MRPRSPRPIVLSTALAVVLAAGAHAQSLNIDLGARLETAPAPTYGAAADQPGRWNVVRPGVPAGGLIGVDGERTEFLLSFGTPVPSGVHDHDGTERDAEALLDDFARIGPAELGSAALVLGFDLVPGTYDIYTYAWSPHDATDRTQVAIAPSLDPPQAVGGVWKGEHAKGLTYAKHRLSGGGSFTLTVRTIAGEGVLNAIQIVRRDPPPIGERYCGPAVVNSTGRAGRVSATGSATAADNRLTLVASDLPPNRQGYFLFARAQGFVANPGGSQGHLCLAGEIGRFQGALLHSGPHGTFSLDVDLVDLPIGPGHSVVAGETWNFQAWYRDENPDATSNLTDAVSIEFR